MKMIAPLWEKITGLIARVVQLLYVGAECHYKPGNFVFLFKKLLMTLFPALNILNWLGSHLKSVTMPPYHLELEMRPSEERKLFLFSCS